MDNHNNDMNLAYNLRKARIIYINIKKYNIDNQSIHYNQIKKYQNNTDNTDLLHNNITCLRPP